MIVRFLYGQQYPACTIIIYAVKGILIWTITDMIHIVPAKEYPVRR